ncbi:MAG: hypothetical protein IPK27_20345 [Rhodanobacteraceae bacterium]|nr:hypothetical protein [Rhodanobacteraceae bacterium]
MRRAPEQRVVDVDIDLGLFDRDLLPATTALRAGFHRERQVDAANLLVVAEFGFHLGLDPTALALVHHQDLEEVVRIQITVLHVAVLQADLQLVRLGAVDILGAEVLHLVPLGLPVDQRAVEICLHLQALGILGAHAFRIAAALEGIDRPGLLAIVGGDLGQALDARFHAQLGIALIEADDTEVDAEVAAGEVHAPGGLDRLDRADGFEATACFDVLRDEFVDSERVRGGCARAEHERQQQMGTHGWLRFGKDGRPPVGDRWTRRDATPCTSRPHRPEVTRSIYSKPSSNRESIRTL